MKIGLFFTSAGDDDLEHFYRSLSLSLLHLSKEDHEIHVCYSVNIPTFSKGDFGFYEQAIGFTPHPLQALYPDLGCNTVDLNNCYKFLKEIGCTLFIHLNDDVHFVRYWLEHLLQGQDDPSNLLLPNDGLNQYPMSNFHAFTDETLKVFDRELPYVNRNENLPSLYPIQCYFLDTEMVCLGMHYKILRYCMLSYIIHQNHISRPAVYPRKNRQRVRTIEEDIPAFVRNMEEHRCNPHRYTGFNFPIENGENKVLLESLKRFI